MRVGMGYDVHKLTPDRDLILGGVLIPYEKGLLGHSDADVVVANFMMPELKKKPFICTSSLSSLELVEKLNAFFYDFTSAEH